MNGWNSVDKRLPPECFDVLVYSDKYNCYTVAHWIASWKEWRDIDDEVVEGVSNWRLLPYYQKGE